MTTVSAARLEWRDGNRRFLEEARDPACGDVLHRQRDVVLDELRRRVGTTFTLAELVAAYAASEHWVREVIEERAPSKGWARTVSLSGDAAFHAYSTQAQDYEP
jgi:hypothetical protein